MNSLENQSMLKTIFKEPPRLRAVSLCLRSYLTKKVNLLDMLVRVTLVWRLWQWDATKKTQWESVQACLWFPYKFFFFRIPLEIRYNLNSFSSKSVVPNFIAGSSPAKKFRQVFLDRCYAGLFWKVKSDPMPFESKMVPTECSPGFPEYWLHTGRKKRLQSLWAQAQSLWVILWPIFQEQIRIDNAEKLCFFFH